ncbi:MAG: protease inhibitor I9 family protein, partial [Acidimicrobiia bacterium]
MTLGERRSRGGSFRGLGLLVPAGALALAFGFWPPVVADNEVSTPGPAAAAVHLVELRPAPVASYDGGLEHLPATSPAATGLPLDPPETAAGRYRDWLDTVERDALTSARIDGDAVISRYRNTFAGFAARLTPAQAAALQDTPQVRSVAPASAGTVERLRVSESGELPVAQPGLMLEADGEESLATSGGWALAGRVTVRRTFTGTDPAPATWTAEIEGLPGISAVVTPDRFDVAPRGTVTLTLELTRVDAAFDEISSGALVLTHAGDGRTVRLDVTARPVALAVPDALSSPDAGSRGHRLLPARAGYAGILDVSGHGPVPGTRHLGEGIGPVTEDTRRFGVSPGCNIYHLDVPEGAVALAARLDLPVEAAGTGPE